MACKLHWSEEAASNLESILEYLDQNWSAKEIANFKQNLGLQLDLIVKKPTHVSDFDSYSKITQGCIKKADNYFL